MGRKTHTKDRDWDEATKLKVENKRLRNQVSKLRKVISRLDFEQYAHVRDLLEAHEKEDVKEVSKREKISLEEKWKCYHCDDGVLRLVMFHRMGKPYYFRKCDGCTHRTKMKPYNEEVEGVK